MHVKQRGHIRHCREYRDDMEVDLPSWSLCAGNNVNINNLNIAQEGVSVTHRGVIGQEESGAGK